MYRWTRGGVGYSGTARTACASAMTLATTPIGTSACGRRYQTSLATS